jgi:hypothetical protein
MGTADTPWERSIGEPNMELVMPGLVPGTHVFLCQRRSKQDVDGRDKPGHDGGGMPRLPASQPAVLAGSDALASVIASFNTSRSPI